MKTVKSVKKSLLRAALLVVFLGSTAATAMQAQDRNSDVQIQEQLTKTLNNKRFSGVQSSVKSGEVTLTGTVDVYSAKEDADRRVHRTKGVVGVRNMIEVSSTTKLSDTELRDKLAEKIAYDRVGYGTTAFNSFTIGVQDGVVTLGGVAYGPTDKDSALSIASNYPGVKDVIDNIEVAPVSLMDDRIRLDVARAVYGFPSLNKYAIDPAKPIRITVVSGNVTLNGIVNNQSDKDAAGIRANGVSGVFKVTNSLQVAGQKSEQ